MKRKNKTGKIITIFTVFLLCAVILCCPISALYDEEMAEPYINIRDQLTSGDWKYYDMGESLCVCGYTGKDEKITIPSEINGKKVTKVSGRKTSTEAGGRKNLFSEYADSVKEIIIPEGVIAIGLYTFENSLVEKISLPKSLISIGYCAFYNCLKLTSITIPENVKTIGRNAFEKSGIEEILLPEGLESIGEYAFHFTPLKSIYIPDTVSYIGEYAFRKTELEEITLPKSLVKAESCILANNQNLKRVYISEGTTKLEDGIFDNSKNLEEIYLPSTLCKSGEILNNNQSLKTIYFAGDESDYKELFGVEDIKDALVSSEWREQGSYREIENIKLVYNTPVPIAEPVPYSITYPKEEIELDSTEIMLLSVTLLGITLTAALFGMYIAKTRSIKKEKAEAKLREEKEGFHPEILGVWQCGKCGTANSPIANYCYKCGRKRG